MVEFIGILFFCEACSGLGDENVCKLIDCCTRLSLCGYGRHGKLDIE